MPIRYAKTSTLVRLILRWYGRTARQLPWRGTPNPYRVLVSEVMLQQTQVERVLQKYPLFLKAFPDFKTLASARTSAVIRAWQGMGYNMRAIRLQRLAQVIQSRYKGKLPHAITALLNLPGIGRYTAHAIACFAFRQNVPVVDTNVLRVLTRLYPADFGRRRSAGERQEKAWRIALRILPAKKAYDWNQALMDLGATICTASNPKCAVCPVQSSCPSAFKRTRKNVHLSKPEPGRDGIPNRIYRGRIVESLRNLNGMRWIAAERLGKRIKRSYSEKDRQWLQTLLRKLEADGLLSLKVSNKKLRVSLPR